MKVTVLGSASIAHVGAGNPAVLLTVGDRHYLFDAGDGVAAKLNGVAVSRFYDPQFDPSQALNSGRHVDIDIFNIPYLFISHPHLDHCGGLPGMLMAMSLWWKRYKDTHAPASLQIHMPRQMIAATRRFLKAALFNLDAFPIGFVPLKRGLVVQDDLVTVRAILNGHAVSPGKPRCSYSFIVDEHRGRRFAYSGDLANAAEIEQLTRRPIDLLISECGHIDLDQMVDVLKDRPIGQLVLTHVRPIFYGHPDKLLDSLNGRLSCRVTVARDGLAVDV